jgi:hypothetical protein
MFPVIKHWLSDGQEHKFLAAWASPEPDLMRALEYLVEHEPSPAIETSVNDADSRYGE